MSEVPPILDAGLLLQHAEGLRALVRRLVLDDHRVDDVLQETWLRALQTPPRHSGAWGSWLRTVATRLAMRSRRRDNDRPRREGAAAELGAPEDAPSPAEIVEREMARRKVVDVVMTLKEPYRDAILLRFFENLSAQDIATRLQLPLETVRTRIKRAITQLRERLDDTHGGEPQRWHASLLPLLSLPIAPLANTAAATAALSIGWKLWALRAAVALLALLGALTTYAALQVGADDTAIPAVTFTAAELQPVDAWDETEVSAEPALGGTLARALLDEDDARPTIVVEGRVVDGSGRPLAEAEVTLILRSRWPTRRAEFATRHERVGRSVHTASDGRFRFIGPAYDETVLLVTACHPALAPAVVADAWHHDEGVLQLDDLVLHVGHRVVGRVVTNAGTPLQGARVLCRPDAARSPLTRSLAELIGAVTTDARGQFSIDGVPEGRFVLGVSADAQMPTVTGPMVVGDGHVADAGTIELPATTELHGEVRDFNGLAIADARVEAWIAKDDSRRRWRGRALEPETSTDADGRFVLPTAPDGPLLLRVIHDGFATVEHGPLTAGTTWTEVRLPPRVALPVLVVDAISGAAVENYAVRALPVRRGNQRDGGAADGKVEHHADGHCSIDGLQPGSYRISVSAAGYQAQTTPALAVASGNAPVVVRLERGVELRGRVYDAATGTPLAGALVELGSNVEPTARFEPSVLLRTDSDGRFANSSMGAGATVVRVSTKRHAPQIVACNPGSGGEELVVHLDVGATVSGRVTDHPRGRRGMVVFEDESGIRRTAPLDAASGRYTVEHLAAGRQRVHVEVAGRPWTGGGSSREFTVTGTGRLHFDLATVDPLAATLRVRLTDVTDSATLTAVLQGEPSAERRRGMLRAAAQDGLLSFDNVAPGAYLLKILRRGDSESRATAVHERRIELAPGAQLDLDVSLAALPTEDHR